MVSLSWYQNQKKTLEKKKLQANISGEYRRENPQPNISKPKLVIYKNDNRT